jgi:hypothetical protein
MGQRKRLREQIKKAPCFHKAPFKTGLDAINI